MLEPLIRRSFIGLETVSSLQNKYADQESENLQATVEKLEREKVELRSEFDAFKEEQSVDSYFKRLENTAMEEGSYLTIEEIRERLIKRVDEFLASKSTKQKMEKHRTIYDYE